MRRIDSGQTAAEVQQPRLTDDALLGRIAAVRCSESFHELYQRYQATVLNLALRLRRNRDAAEEAAQEAWVQIWQSAHSYRSQGDGHCRGWIYKITANVALHGRHRNASDQKRVLVHRTIEDAHRSGASAADPAEGLEARPALARALETLPEIQRHILIHYYAHALSQKEIGALLKMPQRTVSFHLSEALKKLRSQLRKQGVLEGLGDAHLAPAALADALGLDGPAPDPAAQRVWEGLAARLNDARPVEAKSPWAVLGVCAGVLAVSTAVILNSPLLHEPPEPPPVAGASRRDSGREGTGALKWSFDRPDDTHGLRMVLNGGAHWQPSGGLDNGPFLAFSHSGKIHLPHLDLPFPILVSVHFRTIVSDPLSYLWGLECQLIPTHPFVCHLFDNRRRVIYPNEPTWHTVHYYVTADSIDKWLNGERGTLMVLKTGDVGRDLVLEFTGVSGIDELEVRPLPPSATPNLAGYRRVLAAQSAPESETPRELRLAELPSSRPPLKTRLDLNVSHPGSGGPLWPKPIAADWDRRAQDFDRLERLDDFVVEGGAWQWEPGMGTHGSPALKFSGKNPRLLLEGWPVIKPPIRITLRFKLLEFRRGQQLPVMPVSIQWQRFLFGAYLRFAGDPIEWKAGEWMTFSAKIADTCIEQSIDGRRLPASYFLGRGPTLKLCIEHPLLVDDLHMEPLPLADQPQDGCFLQAIKRIPKGSAEGEIPVPEVPSTLPGRQVQLHYYRSALRKDE